MRISRIVQMVVLLPVLIFASATAPAAVPAVSSRTPHAISAAFSEKSPTLLADEVIRRLRRLGLNFVKNRISHPYDPFGEIC